MTPDELKKLNQIKAQYAREGRTFAGFAREHNFPENEVYKVTGGLYKCRRGRAHDIAVALGVKPKPESHS